IFLIRHAKSSWGDPSLTDFNRPLNKRGERDAPFMAQVLYEQLGTVDKIVSSPAKRAFTTASAFAETFSIPIADIKKEERIYEAFPSIILDVIRSLDNSWSTVLLFGHNPAFTSVANHFPPFFTDNVPTCGIVHIVSSADTWQKLSNTNSIVQSYHYPKQYFQ
ncbi:MAG: histidine phosphatase family protein, partial [Bacteroidota bacterium]